MRNEFRIDLHAHSYHSKCNQNIFQKIFCVNESYDHPYQVYRQAMKMGMNGVTLCDHDEISGALVLKEKYPETTFISEEISAFFPEDGYIAHIVALDITPAQHQRIQQLRKNIYRLTIYLKEQQIIHFLAHPSFGPRFSPNKSHLERFMVMFPIWEFLNASRSPSHRQLAKDLAAIYNLDLAKDLAQKYSLPMPEHTKISGVAGSDAHTRKDMANAYSVVYGAQNYRQFLEGITKGEVELRGQNVNVEAFSATIYDTIRKHFSFGRDTMRRYLPKKTVAVLPRLGFAILKSFTAKNKQSIISNSINKKVDKVISQPLNDLFKKIAKGREIDAFEHILTQIIKVAFQAGPYFYSIYHNFSQENFLRSLRRDFFPKEKSKPHKIALLADMMIDNNGISTRVKEIMRYSIGQQISLLPISCGEGSSKFITVLPAANTANFPFYKGIKVHFPSLSDLVSLLEREKVEALHLMTAGPLGLYGLAAAKMMGLPILASYHTDVEEYVHLYSPVKSYAEFYSSFERWFYNQCQMVQTISDSARNSLVARGIKEEKISLLKTGINREIFTPKSASLDWRENFAAKDEKLLLYTGRLVKEKNVDFLCDIFSKLAENNKKVKLLIVGEGFERERLTEVFTARGLSDRVHFLNWLPHYDLPMVYASSDLFLFPSNTETFGNVVLEALACGLPAVVSNAGACQELVRKSGAGVVCRADDLDYFVCQIQTILSDEQNLLEMKRKAREFAKEQDWSLAIDKLFSDYLSLLSGADKGQSSADFRADIRYQQRLAVVGDKDRFKLLN